MKLLSEAIGINKSLEKLQLSFCMFSDEVIRSIHTGIGQAARLKEVDLSNNGLQDVDLKKMVCKIITG
jgi:Ran GTPase-activating protein (RanGAP) involved in mRNA processing and transport